MVSLFYTQKEAVSLSPQKGSLRFRGQSERRIAEFVLNLKWSAPPSNACACGFLDANMSFQPGSTIDHDVQVDVEKNINAEGKYVTYDELCVHTPHRSIHNRVDALVAFASMPTSPARPLTAGNNDTLAHDGTLVDDLGETFTSGLDVNEFNTVRKVRLDGRTVWLLTSWTNNTVQSFVGEVQLLIPKPQLGRKYSRLRSSDFECAVV